MIVPWTVQDLRALASYLELMRSERADPERINALRRVGARMKRLAQGKPLANDRPLSLLHVRFMGDRAEELREDAQRIRAAQEGFDDDAIRMEMLAQSFEQLARDVATHVASIPISAAEK